MFVLMREVLMPIAWRLNEVMARYGVRGVDLVNDLGLTKESVSRLRKRRTMPTIGPDRLDPLLAALNKYSSASGESVGVADLIDWQAEVEHIKRAGKTND